MLLKLYTSIIKVSEKKFAPIVLSLVALIESVFFPIPPDMLLIPMSLAQRNRAFFFAGLVTVFSVIGGAIGYLLGSVFWMEIGKPLTNVLGYTETYSAFELLYMEYGVLIVIIGAFTPFPFKIIAIMSGVMGFSFLNFLITAFLARGIRFYIIAGVIFFWGHKIDKFLKNYLGVLFLGCTIIVTGAYLIFQ